jgi:hypothetical protein
MGSFSCLIPSLSVGAPHDAKLQSALLAVLAKHKPDDEIKAEAIVRDTINEDCERRSRELKRRHAERTFGQHYWDVGAVLSWIAYRDGAMICQFEDYQHWQRVKRYGHEAAWKVVDPGTEMIGALQDGRLRAIQKKSSELPGRSTARILGAENCQRPLHD